jgi:signal transduction histidine kinase
MKSKSWLLLALSFAVLIILIAAFGYTAMNRARSIHHDITAAHESYIRTDTFLRGIPTDMYLAGLLVRDCLLDPSPTSTATHQQQLQALEASIGQRLRTLEPEVGTDATPSLKRLDAEVEAYWDSLDPIFQWTPEQRKTLGPSFLLHNVLPRWNAVVELADEITKLNAANLRREQQRLEASQDRFQIFLQRILMLAILLGCAVTLFSTWRFFVLEKRNEKQLEHIEHAEQELRRLSRRLVQAQEEERKFISRELHDSVGQTLTAVGMELGNLGSLRSSPGEFDLRLSELKRLNTETLGSLRDLAMGLRPSMLDDIGLGPALEWQGRQFSRRFGVPVIVEIKGMLDDLPDTHRTCIYRAVQEALTNCAKHANAKSIRILVEGSEKGVRVIIQDDGIGFDRTKSDGKGLGLLGIQERVEELAGTLTVVSAANQGTTITLNVPVLQRTAQ